MCERAHPLGAPAGPRLPLASRVFRTVVLQGWGCGGLLCLMVAGFGGLWGAVERYGVVPTLRYGGLVILQRML